MVTYFTYILKSQTDRIYIAHTNNLEDRFVRHNQNRVKSTKNKGPWKLLKAYQRSTRSEAIKLERYLTSLKGPLAVPDYIKNNPD